MNLTAAIRDEIMNLLSTPGLKMLLLNGKIGKDTSVELMKIVKDLDNSPGSEDLFFAYHHPFEKPRDYFSEIEKDIREQYITQKTEIDPGGTLEPVFNRDYTGTGGDKVSSFSTFLKDLSWELTDVCRNLVILLDPEVISDPSKFNQALDKILDTTPEKVKFIVFEDALNQEKAGALKKRGDLKQFKIPSSVKEITDYMENALLEDKTLTEQQRAEYRHALGEIYAGQGIIDKALPNYEEALLWFTQNGNVGGECTTLNSIGLMYYLQKQYGKATEFYLVSLNRSATNQLLPIALFCASQLARISLEQEKKTEALEFYKRGLGICEEAKDEASSANVLLAIGEILLGLGKSEEAVRSFEQALIIDKKSGNFFGEARELSKLAIAYKKIGKSRESKDCQLHSEQIQKEKGFYLEVKK